MHVSSCNFRFLLISKLALGLSLVIYSAIFIPTGLDSSQSISNYIQPNIGLAAWLSSWGTFDEHLKIHAFLPNFLLLKPGKLGCLYGQINQSQANQNCDSYITQFQVPLILQHVLCGFIPPAHIVIVSLSSVSSKAFRRCPMTMSGGLWKIRLHSIQMLASSKQAWVWYLFFYNVCNIG